MSPRISLNISKQVPFFQFFQHCIETLFLTQKLSIKVSLWNFFKDGDFLCVLDHRASSDLILS